MKESVLVLVAAGAGPDISTSFLTNELIAWKGIPAPEAGLPYGARSDRPFFEWLVDVSRTAYPPEGSGGSFGYRPPIGPPNFEELIHLVERLSYLTQEHYYDSPYKRPPPYEADFYRLSEIGEFLKDNKCMSLYDVVIAASNHILDIVAEKAAHNRHVEASLVIDTLSNMRIPKIFSLNYDTRVIAESDRYWTGFQPMNESELTYAKNNGRTVFRFAPQIPDQCRSFIQMHGSTHFGWIEDYIAPRYKIARYPMPLTRRGTPRRDGLELWNDRSVLPALPMITGFRKGEKTLIEPYLSYLHYFRAEAYRTPNWVILGYGGGDPHINAIMRSASDYWGSKLRAFVFNYVDQETRCNDEARANAARARISYLGWNARATPTCDNRDGVLRNGSIAITLDGEYASHIERLIDFQN